MGVGRGVNYPTLEKFKPVKKTLTNEITRLAEDGDPERGIMTLPSQTRKVAGKPIHLLTSRKSILVGTWNIRTMFQAGKAASIAKEMVRYNLSVLGLAETRWTQSGEVNLASV